MASRLDDSALPDSLQVGKRKRKYQKWTGVKDTKTAPYHSLISGSKEEAIWLQSTAMHSWTAHQKQGLIISFALLHMGSTMACHVRKSSHKCTWSGIKHMMMKVATEWALLLLSYICCELHICSTKQALVRKWQSVTSKLRCKPSFQLETGVNWGGVRRCELQLHVVHPVWEWGWKD